MTRYLSGIGARLYSIGCVGTATQLKIMQAASAAQSRSCAPGTKVGAVLYSLDHDLVLESACNDLPEGLDRSVDSRWEAPAKYLWMEHAEREVLFKIRNVDRQKHPRLALGTTKYPCAACARAMLQHGIECVVTEPCPLDDPNTRCDEWNASWEVAREMLHERQIPVLEVSAAMLETAGSEARDGPLRSQAEFREEVKAIATTRLPRTYGGLVEFMLLVAMVKDRTPFIEKCKQVVPVIKNLMDNGRLTDEKTREIKADLNAAAETFFQSVTPNTA